ncbi:ATP synthase subunit gamma, mitochondrial-like [Dorcoceras hygrometricum]|uniref:ATP synthase subunit gamma, mitochondrial-like n=1 Tax=Dorcoceras hygrometricum TaxID=472368 RepID=A0A2Z7C976_9LAMI|nr:ATP synthase subunit gamma, mitochondrial-like [Dorcoceras hygrometricum]
MLHDLYVNCLDLCLLFEIHACITISNALLFCFLLYHDHGRFMGLGMESWWFYGGSRMSEKGARLAGRAKGRGLMRRATGGVRLPSLHASIVSLQPWLEPWFGLVGPDGPGGGPVDGAPDMGVRTLHKTQIKHANSTAEALKGDEEHDIADFFNRKHPGIHGLAQQQTSNKFGHQCPTSPILPPRKVPLEDLIYTSCTDPITQPAAARTPRLHQPSAVTHLFYAYVRKATNTEFNVVVLGRDLIFGDVPAGYYHRKNHRLNLSAKAKCYRIHLSKRHRLTTANIKFHRLVKQSTVALDWTYCSLHLDLSFLCTTSDSLLIVKRRRSISCASLEKLLIVMTSLLTSSSLIHLVVC